MRRKPPRRPDRRSESGVASLELAIAAPVFILLLLAVVEFGRALWINHTVQFAAEEAGRYVMLHTAASASEIGAYTRGKATGIDPARLIVQVASESIGAVQFVTVTASYRFDLVSGMVPFDPVILTGRSRVPLPS